MPARFQHLFQVLEHKLSHGYVAGIPGCKSTTGIQFQLNNIKTNNFFNISHETSIQVSNGTISKSQKCHDVHILGAY